MHSHSRVEILPFIAKYLLWGNACSIDCMIERDNGSDHRAGTIILQAEKTARKPGFACITLLSRDSTFSEDVSIVADSASIVVREKIITGQPFTCLQDELDLCRRELVAEFEKIPTAYKVNKIFC